MTNSKTIYILCLEKGYECGDTGISYWEMIEYLKDKDAIDPANFEFHQYFFTWFFDNFYLAANYVDRRQNRMGLDPRQTAANQPVNPALWFNREWLSERYGHSQYQNAALNGQLELKVPMMYETRQKYLDYLSLKASETKAEQANILSKIAIIISISLGLISIIIGIWQIYYADRQEKFNLQQELSSTAKEGRYLKHIDRINNEIRKVKLTEFDTVNVRLSK